MNRKQLWFSTLSCIVFALVVWVLFSVWSEGNNAVQCVERTHKVIEDLNGVSAAVQSVESNFRGYLNTGNKLYLQASAKAKATALARAQSLETELSADRGQRAGAVKLRSLIEEKFEWEKQVLAAYQTQGPQGATALTRTMRGMQTMEMVRSQLRELETNENAILGDRRDTYTTYRALLLTAAGVLSAVGGVALWQAIRLDVLSIRIESQRVQAYDRLEQLNQQLNKQVADLLAAQEETNKALKVRSEFLAKVSHELRTPLAGVIGATELTLRMPLLEEQRDLVATAKQCGESLLSVINDVLNFEKMESQEFHIQSSEFDLPAAVQSALEPLRMKANAKGLKFDVEISDRVPALVFGDRLRIQQVLVNLVDNAIKFTDEGSVSIRVAVLSGEAHSTMVQFRVIDTGAGFALDQLPRIFEPFEQLETFMTRRHAGTGLGLAISNKLVNLMNGTIEVLSQPNQGSEFSFAVPLDLKAAATDVPEQVPAGAGMESSGCILVVDDNATMRKITQLQLKKLGYEVQLASSGEEAVEATSKQRYLLIIMDVQMQGIDGLEAAKIIRSSQDNPCRDIPIVALTAHAMTEDLERCLAVGMNDYVAKPATLQSIEAVISKWTAPAAKYSGDSINFKRTS